MKFECPNCKTSDHFDTDRCPVCGHEFGVYSISSLRDIFELPSYDAMERCLTELKTMMLHARAMTDLLNSTATALAAQDGVELPTGTIRTEWPETVQWIDDDAGSIETRWDIGDGHTLVSEITRTTSTKE